MAVVISLTRKMSWGEFQKKFGAHFPQSHAPSKKEKMREAYDKAIGAWEKSQTSSNT